MDIYHNIMASMFLYPMADQSTAITSENTGDVHVIHNDDIVVTITNDILYINYYRDQQNIIHIGGSKVDVSMRPRDSSNTIVKIDVNYKVYVFEDKNSNDIRLARLVRILKDELIKYYSK